MISYSLQTAKSELMDALRECERSPKVRLPRARELERLIAHLEALQHKMPADV